MLIIIFPLSYSGKQLSISSLCNFKLILEANIVLFHSAAFLWQLHSLVPFHIKILHSKFIQQIHCLKSNQGSQPRRHFTSKLLWLFHLNISLVKLFHISQKQQILEKYPINEHRFVQQDLFLLPLIIWGPLGFIWWPSGGVGPIGWEPLD